MNIQIADIMNKDFTSTNAIASLIMALLLGTYAAIVVGAGVFA